MSVRDGDEPGVSLFPSARRKRVKNDQLNASAVFWARYYWQQLPVHVGAVAPARVEQVQGPVWPFVASQAPAGIVPPDDVFLGIGFMTGGLGFFFGGWSVFGMQSSLEWRMPVSAPQEWHISLSRY